MALVGSKAQEGERKQVTVLFADVVGSMDLAARMDPEVWGELMERLFDILRAGVNRFGGRIDKFTGDGAMALFGAPIAYEDHARRACSAALALRDELARYGRQLKEDPGIEFAVRVGLNSGEVIVGSIGQDLKVEYTAVGNTVGLAQRMEALARPGTVCVSAVTAALVRGYFELRDLGTMEAKGLPEAVHVFELAGQGAFRTPLEVAAARGFSRFVGRDREMAMLEGALDQSSQGHGQFVGIVAEPGVGKSRLTYEFGERCRDRNVEVLAAHALVHARSVPFVPLLEIIRTQFGITEQDGAATARAKVAVLVRELDPTLVDTLPLLWDFLGVADPERPAIEIDADARQRRIFKALNCLWRARSARVPLVILVEDLHWLDPASEAFLENLFGSIPGTRVLVVTTFRPEYRPSWAHRSHYARLPLGPLNEEASEELLRSLLGPHPSLDGVAALVRERTGGNPFFMEEVVQGLVEDGELRGSRGAYELASTIGTVKIPPTVQAVLAARIDRLSEGDKALLQTASVIGRQFSRRLVKHVSGLPQDALEAALRTLVEAELVYEAAVYPDEEYTFKHALTEEVAYGSQLVRRRTRTHAAVARALTELDVERLDERASLIAWHHELGGQLLEAARWNARAAGWAGYSHPSEAARHWRRVRTLTDALGPSSEAGGLGITARLQLLSLHWRLGAAIEEEQIRFEDEAATVFAEADAFADATGQLAVKVMLLSAYGALRAQTNAVREGWELTVRAVQLADETGDPALRAVARVTQAWGLFLLGRVREAAAVAGEMIPIIGEDRSVGRGTVVASPYAWCRLAGSFFTGYFDRLDQGLLALEQSIALLEEEGDDEMKAYAHRHWALFADLAGHDPELAATHALQGMQWAEDAGGPWSRIFVRAGLATSHAQRGEWMEAIEVVDEGLAMARDRRIAIADVPLLLAIRARAQIGLGDTSGARSSASEGIAVAVRYGTRLYESQVRHQLARAILADPGPGDEKTARDELDLALSIIEALGIRALEPQIHVERAQLAQATGDDAEFDRELREAHRLLIELGADGRAAEVGEMIRGGSTRRQT